ncbi:excisionase family DNA-binding protein [Desulfobulbus sp. AH-315-M07]|nr:excisionase family DNA-binding protein [Desulfobulbus sp. AH-315-M07]
MKEIADLVDNTLRLLVERLRANPELVSELRSILVVDGVKVAKRPYETVDGFAERVGVSRRTVDTWIHQGLPVVRSGRLRRIPVEEADAWLKAGGGDAVIERRARLDARRRVRRLHASNDDTGDGVRSLKGSR